MALSKSSKLGVADGLAFDLPAEPLQEKPEAEMKQIIEEVEEEQIEKKRPGRPKGSRATYRTGLYLDVDLKNFVHYRMDDLKKRSITQYLNDLIRNDMESCIAEGADPASWDKK